MRSCSKWIIPITSQRAAERAMYSALVVLKAVRDWIFDFQRMGHPAYKMTKPVQERVDMESREDGRVQDLAQSALT